MIHKQVEHNKVSWIPFHFPSILMFHSSLLVLDKRKEKITQCSQTIIDQTIVELMFLKTRAPPP